MRKVRIKSLNQLGPGAPHCVLFWLVKDDAPEVLRVSSPQATRFSFARSELSLHLARGLVEGWPNNGRCWCWAIE